MIKHIVEHRYDLGKFVDAREIFGGTVNTSFRVRITGSKRETEDYFLREYNPAVLESEIRFEHAFLNHLRSSGFELASVPFPGRDGATYFRETASSSERQTKHFWALFDFLKGEDKYSWTHTDLTDQELASSAEILARLHHHGADFMKPPGAERAQPPIMGFLPILKQNFVNFTETAPNCQCSHVFNKHASRVQSILDTGIAAEADYHSLLKIPIHCDFHPGNLKFENGTGVGLFDFDWSKVDYRVFDVALSLFYFTAQWRGKGAGCIRLDPFKLFLSVYQETCSRSRRVPPMSPLELRALAPMLAYANLFVLNWSVVDFCEKSCVDDDAYYTFIQHGIRVMQWIEDNESLLVEAIREADRPGHIR